jgi:hypothetical protein
MHETGLSARVAGASSSPAATNAGDGDDESKTRKAHPAFSSAAALNKRKSPDTLLGPSPGPAPPHGRYLTLLGYIAPLSSLPHVLDF